MAGVKKREKRRGRYALGKQPYVYQFKTCKHATVAEQRVLYWRGTICTACNIIVERERSSGWHER